MTNRKKLLLIERFYNGALSELLKMVELKLFNIGIIQKTSCILQACGVSTFVILLEIG